MNDQGQLGDLPQTVHTPTTLQGLPPIRTCAAGWNFCIFLGEDDSLWTMGCNTHGTLCNGTFSGISRSPIKIAEAPIVVTVSCGWNHSLFVDCDGNAWCSGEGNNLPFGSSECVSVLSSVGFPKRIQVTANMKSKNVKSARKI